MSKREDYKRFIVFCLASLVVLAQAAVFAWVWYSVYRGQIDEPFWRKGNWVLIAIYGLMFALFAKLYGGLKVGYLKRIDVFYSLTLALLCTNVVEYLQITLLHDGEGRRAVLQAQGERYEKLLREVEKDADFGN